MVADEGEAMTGKAGNYGHSKQSYSSRRAGGKFGGASMRTFHDRPRLVTKAQEEDEHELDIELGRREGVKPKITLPRLKFLERPFKDD